MTFLVHPVSGSLWVRRRSNLSLKYSLSRNPQACLLSVSILFLMPSTMAMVKGVFEGGEEAGAISGQGLATLTRCLIPDCSESLEPVW